ncbi:MAG: ABC transporter ATP-binding protein [Planctomycetota bacterium]|nr:MAG: ABC transporter ATP-binding protein [Planctomycetota bacterium]
MAHPADATARAPGWAATHPSAAQMPVEVRGVIKRYGRRTVLDRVTLDVPPGITGLVGPNGAGKSTLVRAILGLVHLTEGSVRVFGLDPRRRSRMVRQMMGVVPEDECSIPGLSGVEMVRYAARLSGLPGTEALRRAHEVLDWCDAGQERYRAVETLSVGMRQKISFAAAIVHDPRMVILDEPTNGLDPIERRAMLGRLTTLARDHGKTILISTHVLPDVQSVCDRVVVLAGGRVRLAGTIRELTHPAIPEERLEGIGPIDALIGRLTARGIPARRAIPSPSELPAPPGGGTILFQSQGAEALRAVWVEAADLGVTVRSLEPAHRPLEEVFIDTLRAAAIADGESHDAAP